MKKVLALILALAMAMSLVACGGNGDDSKSNGGDKSGTQPESTSQTGPEQTGNSGIVTAKGEYLKDNINVALSGDGGTLDPFASFVNWGSANMTGLIFQGLIQTDYDYNIYYQMAKSIEQVDDTHWNLEIWDCIYDTNGNQITIDDVIWGYDQCIASGNQGAIPKFVSLDKTGDYTATMTLSEPFGDGDFVKHFGNVKVLSRATYESMAAAATDPTLASAPMTNDPVGTGPYKLADYVIGSSVVLEANEDYWAYNIDGDITDPEDPYYDPTSAQNFKTITYKITQDAFTRSALLESGDVDIADSLEAVDIQNVFQGNDNYNIIDLPQRPPVAFCLNAGEDSILSNLALRQAILYGLDNEKVAAALGVPTTLATSIQPNQVDTPDSWETREYYTYDADKAKDLLEEAGYNGETIKLLYVDSTISTNAATMIKSLLNEIGVNIDITSVDMVTAMDYKYDGTKWDLRLETFGGGAYLSQTIKAWWSEDSAQHLDGGKNISMVADEKLDELYVAVNSLDKTEDDINAWADYFDSQAYGYAICSYSNQTACSGELVSTLQTSNGALMPNVFVLAE